MPVTPSNSPSLTASGTFDPTKGYQKVRFQRGGVVFDVDLNDAQDYLSYVAGRGREALRGGGYFAPTAPVPRQFAVVPLTREDGGVSEGMAERNTYNFGVTPGLLPSRLGMVDTRHLFQTGLQPTVIFDYREVQDQGATAGHDQVWSNVMFRGKVTAGGVGETTKLVDENMKWSADHRLLGTTAEVGGYTTTQITGHAKPHEDASSVPAGAVDDHEYRVREPACRIIFLTGANAGTEVTITSVLAETTLGFAALGSPLALDDEYVIVPGNALKSLKTNYDAAAVGETPLLGLSSTYWYTVFYVHVWEEDISADQDDDLRKTTIDQETVHATELRWCVRTAEYAMSTDLDAGRASLRESHMQSLMELLWSEPHLWGVGAGNAGTPGATDDNQHFPTQVPLVDQTSGNADFQFGDKSYWTGIQGITALQIRMASRGFTSHQNGVRSFLPMLGLEMLYALVSDPTAMDIIPLMMFSPPSKPTAGAELSDKFYPGAFIPQNIVGSFTGDNAMPVMPLNYVQPSVQGDPVPTYYGIIKPIVIVPDQQWLDLPRISTELLSAMLFSRNTHTGDENLLRVNDGVAGDLPLVYESVATRLSKIETVLMGALGLGHQLGRAWNGGYEDGSEEGRIGSARNWVPNGASDSIAQAGQSNRTYSFDTAYQMNPHAATQGAVSMPDPLAGASGWDTANAPLNGDFVPGPGQYRRRDDSGMPVAAADADGWSFFRYLATGLVDPLSPEASFSLRQYEDGVAQAVLTREALAFRKLAIKTVAHQSADLFTYDVQPPWKVNAMDSGVNAVPYHWTVDKHAGLGAVDPKSSLSMVAMPALMDASTDQDLTAVHRTSFDSFSVGALPDAANLLPVGSVWRNYGQSLPLGQGTAPGARNLMWAEKPAVSWQSSAPVPPPLERGAWGRFELSESDTVNMVDTWANRCTSMRLRYHIGDFYPGPITGAGQTVNALVDTMNLYVRLEPLPLTHWATMPKHTHTAVRDSMRSLSGLKELAHILEVYALGNRAGNPPENLVDSNWRPLRTALSPGTPYEIQNEEEDGTAGDGDFSVEVGEVDWRDNPFPDGFQPFIHWFHPNMDLLDGPHPSSGQAPAGGPLGTAGGVDSTMYARWGERSLIIPSITYNPDPPDTYTTTNDQYQNPPTAYAFEGTGKSNDVEELERGQNYGGAGTDDERIESDKLGSHHNWNWMTGTAVNGTIQLRDGTNVTIDKNVAAFPFIPEFAPNSTALAHNQMGVPGPVFLPAFRKELGRNNAGTNTSVGNAGTPAQFRGSHEVFKYLDASAPAFDYAYWPQVDRINDEGNFDDEAGANPFPWGQGSQTYSRSVNGGGTSAFDWTVPVLRSHIRTSTLAAMFALFEGEATFANPTAPTFADADTIAGSMVDSPTDLGFVGDMGCSIAIGGGGTKARTFYVSPLVFSMPHRKDGDVTKRGETAPNSDPNARHDAFQAVQDDIDAAYADSADADWLPLINTFKALYHAGLQQKLLFNSSLRVQHVRPGGGYRDGAAGNLRSTNPKSLTELFLVRNRQTGAAVSWPNAPSNPSDKPFIHLFSMHPAAAGGGAFNAHPNHPYIGHLYPMVADGLGSGFNGVVASGDDLSDPSTTTDTGLYAAEFALDEISTGVQGETYAADAFDIHYADATKAVQADVKLAYSDRLQQNSGVEIDLVSELRFVRENAAAHGLDQVGAGGRSWLDLMPTVEDLTAPGDHEIIFTLYPGRYGQKMIDSSVPDGYNPSFAGLRISATIEVNRPNEKTPSTAGAGGAHYGLSLETHHVLGHS